MTSNDSEKVGGGGEAEQKHTPGPWDVRYKGDESSPGFGIASKYHRGMICEAYFPGNGPEEYDRVMADAELIASAPALHTELHRLRSERAELLAALEGLMAEEVENARWILEAYPGGTMDEMQADVLIAEREAAATTAIANAKSAEAGA